MSEVNIMLNNKRIIFSVFIGIFYTSVARADIISLELIKHAHDECQSDVMVSMSGMCENNIIIDNPESIESMSHYKERSMKGELEGVTPNDVDAYYDNLTKRRIVPMEICCISQGSNKKFVIHYDPYFQKPWDTFEEYIFTNSSFFYIDNYLKIINLSDNKEAKKEIYIDRVVDPLLMLFPLANISDISNVSLLTLQGELRISYTNPNSECLIKTIEAYLDSNYPYCPKRILIKTNFLDFLKTDAIFYTILGDFQLDSEKYLPQKLDIKYWHISNNGTDESRMSSDDKMSDNNDVFKLLYPQDVSLFNLKDLSENTIPPNIRYNYKFDIVSLSFTNDVLDETFWPEVPAKYKYYDKRNRHNKLRLETLRKNVSQDDMAKIKGFGPYKFPQ